MPPRLDPRVTEARNTGGSHLAGYWLSDDRTENDVTLSAIDW